LVDSSRSLALEYMCGVFKLRAAWAFGMILKFVSLHDFPDGCIAHKPFGNPKGSIQSKSFDGVLTRLPVDQMDEVF
jgi:hypothetical protein